MGSTPATFNGTSHYAADLQNAINHALTIASLPLNELNSDVNLLQGQTNELTTLQSKFAAIETAIQSLSGASSGKSLSATVSDNTVATATLDTTAAVTPGTYTLHVVSVGAHTTTISNDGLPTVSDPSATSISTSASYTLTVGGVPVTITPATNSLNALAQAINTSGAGVSATLVNIGSPAAPDYRLSLQSTKLGDIAIQLNDGTNDLLTNLTTGSLAQYQVNGLPATPISSDTTTVTISPGLTVNLLAAGDTTITVGQNGSAATDAISSFVAAYNATATELDQNHGTAGGALTGLSIVSQLEQALRDLTGFTGGSGTVKSIADLGLSFDDHGQLSFNQAQFSSVASAHPADLAAFLGTGTGTGFLASATTILNGLGDSASGTFSTVLNSLQQHITTDNQKISETQSRIVTLQNQLVAQMSAADTLIASLENQVTFFTGLFQATQDAIKSNS